MLKVTLYSKKDCHLCDVAKDTLLRIQMEFPFFLEEIDIEKDKTIFEKYKYLIPVIEIDDKMVSNYRVDENKLKSILSSLPQ